MAATPTGTRYTAAAQFYAMVREFSQRQPTTSNCIIKDVGPGYEWNGLHRIASEVYGSIDEWLTIMAAAGLDSPEQPLSPRTLVLPTPSQLRALKNKAGLITSAWSRVDGQEDNPLST